MIRAIPKQMVEAAAQRTGQSSGSRTLADKQAAGVDDENSSAWWTADLGLRRRSPAAIPPGSKHIRWRDDQADLSPRGDQGTETGRQLGGGTAGDVELAVEGMHCESCVALIEECSRSSPGSDRRRST